MPQGVGYPPQESMNGGGPPSMPGAARPPSPAPRPGGAPPPAPAGQDAGNPQMQNLVMQRLENLSEQDAMALKSLLPREVGLILLKLAPELSAIILQTDEMQGPEMADLRNTFGQDQAVAGIRSQMGGGAPPAPSAGGGLPMPPTGAIPQKPTGLRAI